MPKFKPEWIQDCKVLLDTCAAWRVHPWIVLYPDAYRDDRSATARGVIVRELAKTGLTPGQIADLIPLCERQIRRMAKVCPPFS